MLYGALGSQEIILIVLVVVLIAVLIVMPIFTNKRNQKSVNTLHSSLKIGDKIMTIGGIIGFVTAINQTSPVDKEIVIETGEGSNKTTMLLDIKALYQIIPSENANMTAFAPQQNDVFSDDSEIAEKEEIFESIKEDEKLEAANETETASEEVTSAPKAAPAAKKKSTVAKNNSASKK